MRVFLDTNVLVSAFLARGFCADLFRLVLIEHTLVTSEVVLTELQDVLSRKGRLPAPQIAAIQAFLRDQPVAPWPAQTLHLGLVDPDDEWVVASAVLVDADLFVTGDQGVLACIQPPLPIVNPRGCWERLRSSD
ncbi:putative toxin-antitoxin system toxin component, PIN family [Cyanobium sp. L1E-Cus]|uniref:putative toxin-antitoxin system toxin component, PIN family n=1 Tax=Cyanobium sp. L1E-Cus TaxID=2823714 RepID=UPI0020CBF8D7|nr:putative toxin-antitoxin system toxin component, PIN family [Cyanobium sp. L1E-Cus]MCP9821948.1 putative toxin-antitoxin system toxin component, PIN family [Cyanobium sp. L1E-Cus]